VTLAATERELFGEFTYSIRYQALKQRKIVETRGKMDPLISLGEIVRSLIAGLGPYGVLIGMILESSVIPISSEAVLITAGFAGIDPEMLPSRMDWQLDNADGIRDSRSRGPSIMRATCCIPSFKT